MDYTRVIPPIRYPSYDRQSSADATVTMDAAAERVALCGYVWWPSRTGTKNIKRVHIRVAGSFVLNIGAGSSVSMSLQNVDLISGWPIRPDGIPDQTYVFTQTGSLAGQITGSAFVSTGDLSSLRSVNFLDLVAVVVQFGTFNTGDSVLISLSGGYSSAVRSAHFNTNMFYNGSSWAEASSRSQANVLFEFDDGTYGSFFGTSRALSTNLNYQFTTATSPDEIGLEFQMPFDCKIEGMWLQTSPSTTASRFDIVLYNQESQVIRSGSVSGNKTAYNVGNVQPIQVLFDEYELPANTLHRITTKVTDGTAYISAWLMESGSDAEASVDHGSTFRACYRTNEGAWSTWPSSSVHGGVYISGLAKNIPFSPVFIGGMGNYPFLIGSEGWPAVVR